MSAVEARFMAKVAERADGCWEWMAHRTVKGYGQFWVDGRLMQAHRFAYEFFVGPIPVGMVVDHACRNRGCVNPTHLEAVTVRENTRRGDCGRSRPFGPVGVTS